MGLVFLFAARIIVALAVTVVIVIMLPILVILFIVTAFFPVAFTPYHPGYNRWAQNGLLLFQNLWIWAIGDGRCGNEQGLTREAWSRQFRKRARTPRGRR